MMEGFGGFFFVFFKKRKKCHGQEGQDLSGQVLSGTAAAAAVTLTSTLWTDVHLIVTQPVWWLTWKGSSLHNYSDNILLRQQTKYREVVSHNYTTFHSGKSVIISPLCDKRTVENQQPLHIKLGGLLTIITFFVPEIIS